MSSKGICKGICVRHKVSSRYSIGHKRCKVCELFIKWDGLWCPCCGYKLRTRPRSFKFKAKLREERAIEEAKKDKSIISSIDCVKKRSEKLGDGTKDMKIVPVNFNSEHKAMLGHCKMIRTRWCENSYQPKWI